ncbi:MAG: NAD(P)H-dependent oxidoreductase [Pseudomonadota bacterium]
MPKLLFFAGSARRDSFNKKLAQNAADIGAELGAEATFVDLKDYAMPIYDGDLEAESGLPEAALQLKALFREQDGFFIASPEYNSSFPALLKNTLDWVSRPHEENEPMLAVLRDKVAAISSASPGGFGGLRGLVPLRMMLGNIGVTVVPNQLALSSAHQYFDEAGKLSDETQRKMLRRVVQQFVETAAALKTI